MTHNICLNLSDTLNYETENVFKSIVAADAVLFLLVTT